MINVVQLRGTQETSLEAQEMSLPRVAINHQYIVMTMLIVCHVHELVA